MATKIDQKEYLKRYLSNEKEKKKRKKKEKKAAVAKANVRIIDDDLDLSKLQSIQEDDVDMFGLGEEAPQVVGIIDERPPELRAKEDFGSNKWKVVASTDGFDSTLEVRDVTKRKDSVRHGEREKIPMKAHRAGLLLLAVRLEVGKILTIALLVKLSRKKLRAAGGTTPPMMVRGGEGAIRMKVHLVDTRKILVHRRAMLGGRILMKVLQENQNILRWQGIKPGALIGVMWTIIYPENRVITIQLKVHLEGRGWKRRIRIDADIVTTPMKVHLEGREWKRRVRIEADIVTTPMKVHQEGSVWKRRRQTEAEIVTTPMKVHQEGSVWKRRRQTEVDIVTTPMKVHQEGSVWKRTRQTDAEIVTTPMKVRQEGREGKKRGTEIVRIQTKVPQDASPTETLTKDIPERMTAISIEAEGRQQNASSASILMKVLHRGAGLIKHHPGDTETGKIQTKFHPGGVSQKQRKTNHVETPKETIAGGVAGEIQMKVPLDRAQEGSSRRSPAKSNRGNSPGPSVRGKQEMNRSDSDLSPPRKSDRTGRRDPDESPPRRRRPAPPVRIKEERRSSGDESPPRDATTGRMTKTLEGKRAGLQDARALREENEKHKRREREAFEQMAAEHTGRFAETVVRQKSGRRKDIEKELREEFEKRKQEEKKKEIYTRWGKGVKQVEEYNARLQEAAHEMDKPLARYADDKDLDEHLKQQERVGDPMLEYLRSKRKEENRRAGVPEKPTYQGAFPDNRYGIRPGYRWDGVDRSNGFEKRWFETLSKKKATEEEAYKYSVEDM
uniref:BUD13 homolog n=1 Tax=Anopheles atroparvus TaxID=41427 RepID=A0A182IJX0_ANOAO